VVVTGGHTIDGADLFFDGEREERIEGRRHREGASHGSGCTHSSALAAYMALGHEPLEAARRARVIASEAVGAGLRDVGEGPGPVDVLRITEARRSRPR
jgi:hydroxymethylpyrimidine/phosphomethylpyrimidine kinase